MMRLTGSGMYSRPAPVPKMPSGLVELMEDLTREVLKNNPPNVYEFCANHMQQLILIRDGRAPKQHLTLEQKIKRAQDKMREKAEERRSKYDEEMKRYGIVAAQTSTSELGTLISPEVKKQSSKGKVSDQQNIEESVEPKIKTPIHHEKDLTDALEVEIFHKPLKETAKIIDGASSTISYLIQDETKFQERMENVENFKEGEEKLELKSVDNQAVNAEFTISDTNSIIDNDKPSVGDNIIENNEGMSAEHIRTRRSVESEEKEIHVDISSDHLLAVKETNQETAPEQNIETGEDIGDKQIENGGEITDIENKDDNEGNITENISDGKLISEKISSSSDSAKLEEIEDTSIKEVQRENIVYDDVIPLEIDSKNLIVKSEEQLDNKEAEKFDKTDKLAEDTNEIEVSTTPMVNTVDIAVVTADAVDTATKFGENEQILSINEPNENKSRITTGSSDDICNELKKSAESDSTKANVQTSSSVEKKYGVDSTITEDDSDTVKSNLDEIADVVIEKKLPEQETSPLSNTEPIDQKSEHITDDTEDEKKSEDNVHTLNDEVIVLSLNNTQSLELSEINKVSESRNLVSESVVLSENSIVPSLTEETSDMIESILEKKETYECNGNEIRRESTSTAVHNVADSDSIQENNNEADDSLTTVDKILVIESAVIKDDNESVPEQFVNPDLNPGNVNGKYINGDTENGSESPDLPIHDIKDELPLEAPNADIPNTEKENDSHDDLQSNVSELKKTDDDSDSVGKTSSMDDSILDDGIKGSSDLALNKQSSMDLETAAITIQKVFRSFLFKRGSTFDDTGIENNSMDDDSKVQVDFPVTATALNKERRTLGISRMDTVLQTVNEEKSLSLSTDDSSLSSAATIIQAHVRGFLVRNRLNSHKTSSTSLVNSEATSTSLDGEVEQKANKTVLNIHIVPEGEHFLSRDESLLTSIDLSLDGSPPSSTNLHPLGYDKSEPRKQLKREDAIQSISPPSNNSGKLSEDVDSVKDMLVSDSEQQKIIASIMNEPCHDADLESRDDTPTRSTTIETVIEAHKIVRDSSSSLEQDQEKPDSDEYCKKPLSKHESDENDVITPFEERTQTPTNSDDTLRLVHSGEFHDVVLPTKISRSDASVVREFKNVLVYFLLWNN